jgi:LuxR family maltose regulon positive regulatory protein
MQTDAILVDNHSQAQGSGDGAAVALGPILLTKLHPPPITPDLLPRSHLLERLDKGRQRPLTLISAPAGYGKSVLASAWLETRDGPSAWVSLDEHDNDPVGFLTYVIVAVQRVFPGADLETRSMLRAPSIPPPLVLARSLANDLDRLESFILVLDDYHRISDMAVHELLNELLQHPPRSLHLLITSRGDPPLDLDRMRAKRCMTEIRIRDLNFTLPETFAFLHDVMDLSIDRTAASRLRKETEGWVTGLRLAALSLRHRQDVDGLLGGLQADSRYLQDYLVSEVVSCQPPDVQDWMLKTSVLDRFCAPLCEAVCLGKAQAPSSSKASTLNHPDGDSAGASMSGRNLLQWLQDTALFLVPLDAQHEWFRYHDSFQQALQSHLGQKMGADGVAGLHARASAWFADMGLIDEALQHALAAGDTVRAAELVERHWHDEAEAARWHFIEGWLAKFPTGIKRQRPALLLAEAYGALARFQMARVPPLLESAALLLDDPTVDLHLVGELNFFWGTLSYWQGDYERSVRQLTDALGQVSDEHTHVISNVELVLSLARHSRGQKEFAIQALNERIQAVDSSQAFLLGHLISGLAFIHLLSGELDEARLQAKRMQHANKAIGNATTDAWGWYLQGCADLHAYNLEQACQHFAVAAQQRYTLDLRALLDALAGLALAQELMGRSDAAGETLDGLLALAGELGDLSYLSVARSCLARLSLLRGDLVRATDWLRSANKVPIPSGLFVWLEVPSITQARVLIAIGSLESLDRAADLLRTILQESETSHYACQMIEVAVLQSLALEKQGHSDQALAVLGKAVGLAETGGWIRPFAELGRPMAGLLSRLKARDAACGSSIDRILAALPQGPQGAAPALAPTASDHLSSTPPLLEPLTKRELETLQLLATDLSTEEIAAKMVVAVGTVHTYCKRIYGKLGVHSRFEAVVTAKEIGLL